MGQVGAEHIIGDTMHAQILLPIDIVGSCLTPGQEKVIT